MSSPFSLFISHINFQATEIFILENGWDGIYCTLGRADIWVGKGTVRALYAGSVDGIAEVFFVGVTCGLTGSLSSGDISTIFSTEASSTVNSGSNSGV